MDLAKLLSTIDALLTLGESLPVVGPTALIAESLISIAQKAAAKHKEITGQPLDISKLHDIDPVT